MFDSSEAREAPDQTPDEDGERLVGGIVLPAPDAQPPLGNTWDPTLDDAVAELSGDLHAADARLVALVGRCVAEGLWDGFQTPAHWLSWHTALSPTEANQHVEVAQALPGLPDIAAAFGSGRLSFAKVRALTRVATPETEAMLLGWAVAASTAQIIKVSNAIRRVERLRRDDPLAGRFVHWWFDHDGMLVVSARLPEHTGRLLQKAIDAALEHVPDIARAELETAPSSGRDPFDADVGPIELAEAIAEAAGDPLHVRRADALGLLADAALAFIASDRADDGARFQVNVHVEQALLAGDDTPGAVCEWDDGSPAHPDIVRRIVCDADIVTMTSDQYGRVLDIGRRSRRPTRALRRALSHRDRTCRYPGCSNDRFTDAHHIAHWQRDHGTTALRNLVRLCSFHHDRHHAGAFTIQPTHDGRIAFRDPAGRPILAVAPTSGHPHALDAGATGRPNDLNDYTQRPDYSTAVEVFFIARDGPDP